MVCNSGSRLYEFRARCEHGSWKGPGAMTLEAPTGSTLQLWVSDGGAARRWYEDLFGREPDFRPFDDDTFCEWQFKPGYWEIHVVEHAPAGSQTTRLRFGVADIAAERERLLGKGIRVTEVEDLPEVVSCATSTTPGATRSASTRISPAGRKHPSQRCSTGDVRPTKVSSSSATPALWRSAASSTV